MNLSILQTDTTLGALANISTFAGVGRVGGWGFDYDRWADKVKAFLSSRIGTTYEVTSNVIGAGTTQIIEYTVKMAVTCDSNRTAIAAMIKNALMESGPDPFQPFLYDANCHFVSGTGECNAPAAPPKAPAKHTTANGYVYDAGNLATVDVTIPPDDPPEEKKTDYLTWAILGLGALIVIRRL